MFAFINYRGNKMRHFLTLADYSKEEILEILNLAKQIKDETKRREFKDYMPKKTLGMIFFYYSIYNDLQLQKYIYSFY